MQSNQAAPAAMSHPASVALSAGASSRPKEAAASLRRERSRRAAAARTRPIPVISLLEDSELDGYSSSSSSSSSSSESIHSGSSCGSDCSSSADGAGSLPQPLALQQPPLQPARQRAEPDPSPLISLTALPSATALRFGPLLPVPDRSARPAVRPSQLAPPNGGRAQPHRAPPSTWSATPMAQPLTVLPQSQMNPSSQQSGQPLMPSSSLHAYVPFSWASQGAPSRAAAQRQSQRAGSSSAARAISTAAAASAASLSRPGPIEFISSAPPLPPLLFQPAALMASSNSSSSGGGGGSIRRVYRGVQQLQQAQASRLACAQLSPQHPPPTFPLSSMRRVSQLTAPSSQPTASEQLNAQLTKQLQETQSRLIRLSDRLASEQQSHAQQLAALRREKDAAAAARAVALLGKRRAEFDLQAATKRLRQSEERAAALQDAKACVACLAEVRCTAFVPCGHLALCADCATRVQRCPICPQPDGADESAARSSSRNKKRKRKVAQPPAVTQIRIINS